MKEIIEGVTFGIMLTGLFACGMAIGYHEGKQEVYEKYALEDAMESPEYQFIVTDDSISVTDFNGHVGVVKIEGQLRSLINRDNE